MINIRYHVYSLLAVFLALAIGVAAGSTVVQRSVVDNLKSTQGRIEQNLDAVALAVGADRDVAAGSPIASTFRSCACAVKSG